MRLFAASILFFAVVQAQKLNDGDVQTPYGDAPYSHRRLFGIRRLRVLRPLLTSDSPQRVEPSSRRRQQPRFVDSSEELSSFVPRAQVPRAQVPPLLVPPSQPIQGGSVSSEAVESSAEDEVRSTRVILQNPLQLSAHMDEKRRKRIEARWRRLGINFDRISNRNDSPDYPHHKAVTEIERTMPAAIQQLNIPTESPSKIFYREVRPRPRVQGPILRVLSPPEERVPLPADLPPQGDYHSRPKPTFKGIKFTQEKLSVRPRLRIRRPGAPLPPIEDFDPNLTPFMNNARTKYGYGPPKPLPDELPTVPTTTTTIATTTVTTTTPSTTTTAAPTTTAEAETGAPLVDTEESSPITESENSGAGDSGAGFGFGPSELPPEFANVGFGVGGGPSGFSFNVPAEEMNKVQAETTTTAAPETTTPRQRFKQRKQPNPDFDKNEPVVIPQNSGLRAVAPPKEFGDAGGFGSGGFGGGGGSIGGGSGFTGFGGGGGGGDPDFGGGNPAATGEGGEDLFTGDSALVPSKGPTGDGYGPPVFPGGAAPPAVPAVGLGGDAAGKNPYGAVVEVTENPRTTVKPSALLNVLNKADLGFNQAIDHFEHGTPVETAAIDILEVALGSQKLDSQAKLLGHVDRTIGLDNLQRIQRWANTAGALEVFKEQFLKFAKNFQPPPDLLPTVPPQLEYLFKTSGR
ncbi:unnamed protein product [Caenorhabditis auriculariae]|uniref:Uncharacterized protein n=1 Tax=Caenorhabditis auriculariae TaxID=2777116 RepID=A0A8S1HC17_9PELO|nr:unnamed protein product [Caenorhabditis auriculariae]